MAQQFFSRRNISFLLKEVLKAEDLTSYELFRDHSWETFELSINTIAKLAADVMYPLFQEMDADPPRFENGVARVHPGVRPFMQTCGSGGWINPTMSYEQGGQQLPSVVNSALMFVLGAANFSLAAFMQLTTGAANLLAAFGSPDLQQQYLGPMLAGQWQGTMALTEPNAGSSLADIKTTAEDSGEGYYKIKGQKIFITGGSTDATDNTVHMMLARIKGAPAGVKGISLFLVPRYRVTDNGLIANDVLCTGIEHKLGYKGCPACQLTMGDDNDCRGYLVGEPHRGLAYMFQMMNEERVNVGIAAAAKCTAAYYASLEYCQQRLQGRGLTEKNTGSPQIPIIEHPDIKRMLLFQRAVAEGSLALCLQASQYIDLAKVGQDRERYELLVDFLVPLVKTYPSEMGILSTSAAIQCLGGYGYCSDFPVEQYFRDIRIDPIHEGTTGIQGQDLLGRKVTMHNGRGYLLFCEELRKTIAAAESDLRLASYAARLEQALQTMDKVKDHLLGFAQRGEIDMFLGDAALYLELTGIIAVGWQWLVQGRAACQALDGSAVREDGNFYTGKLYTMQYYFDYEMPRLEYLSRVLTRDEPGLAAIPVSAFEN